MRLIKRSTHTTFGQFVILTYGLLTVTPFGMVISRKLVLDYALVATELVFPAILYLVFGVIFGIYFATILVNTPYEETHEDAGVLEVSPEDPIYILTNAILGLVFGVVIGVVLVLIIVLVKAGISLLFLDGIFIIAVTAISFTVLAFIGGLISKKAPDEAIQFRRVVIGWIESK